MAVGYSVTVVQRQPPAAHCHTAVTSQRTRCILHKNLKFRHFTYTAAIFMMELTEHRTKCTVQQPFTVPTDSVQWTLCGVGATD
jgi:hypothetical protein